MDYYINHTAYTNAFALPSAVVDNHLKLAKAEHIKVLLYIFKNAAENPDTEILASATGLDPYDVEEALLYWADAGILLPKEPKPETAKAPTKKAVAQEILPTRKDVSQRGAEDARVRYLMREAQLKLGRNLKSNEAQTLLWLYDDQGLDVSLILLIIQYAVSQGKSNIRFIESVAIDWVNKGIDNINDADLQLKQMAEANECWSIVSRAFGLERRKPSAKETEHALLWIKEWQISREMLVAAYEECVNIKSKFSFAYVSKIIENWHEKGYKTVTDIKPKETSKEDIAAYNLDLYEKMLNSKD